MILLNLILLLIIYKETASHITREIKYNVVLLIIDDLRYLSDRDVALPNIQKMRENGLHFKNTFAQQALCAPSRNSLLTGRRVDSLRLYDFYSYWRHTVGNFTTLPQLFKENGYETYSVGKIFHPGESSNFSDDYPYSWSHYPFHPNTEKYKDAAVCKDSSGRYKKNLVCPVHVSDQPERSLPDLQSLKYAKKILKTMYRNEKQFFMAIGFHKPHIPLKFPRHYLKDVPISNINLPNHPSMPTEMPLVAWHPWTDVRRRDDIRKLHIPFPLGTMPHKWTLKIRQSYFAAAIYIDNLIGKLMSSIDKSNTIVVLTSDHGWSLGENGLWAKYSNFDAALKVPLIFSMPQNMPSISVDAPVELIDVFPTLVDLTGIVKNVPKCKHMDKTRLCFDGKSLVPFIKGKSKTDQDKSVAISQYPRPNVYPSINSDKPILRDIKIMGYSIRTRQYRYTEWISFNSTQFTRDWNHVFGIELYDHDIDQDESNNLHLNLKYKYIKQHLSDILRNKIENTMYLSTYL